MKADADRPKNSEHQGSVFASVLTAHQRFFLFIHNPTKGACTFLKSLLSTNEKGTLLRRRHGCTERVVGYQDGLSEDLKRLLRRIAQVEDWADRTPSKKVRQRAYRQKLEVLLEAISLYPDNFLIAKRRGCFTITSKAGIPSTRSYGRANVHIPFNALRKDDAGRAAYDRLQQAAMERRNRPVRVELHKLHPWPEERRSRPAVPRLQPYYYQARFSQPALAR